jgi:TRAP-type mannitol/chloroaromatic compound transport system permease small subunit
MAGLLRGIDRLSQFLGLSAAHFYLVCALITAYEVVLRYFFNAPTLWAFEVVMVVCAAGWVLSGPYVTMRNSHIGITVLYQYTSGAVRWCLDTFIFLVSIGAMSILAYSLYGPMAEAIHIMEKSGTSFNSPEPLILKTLMFFGAALYAVQSLANLIRHFTGRDRAAVELPE